MAKQTKAHKPAGLDFMTMLYRCSECGRTFDARDYVQANEYYCGHDCEVMPQPKQATKLAPAINKE